MSYISPEQAVGHQVVMKRNDTRHYTINGDQGPMGPQEPKGFDDLLFEAVSGTNNLQQSAENIYQQMIIDPESVDPHDVTIAMSKANMSLDITKAVVDKAIKAYREIISIR